MCDATCDATPPQQPLPRNASGYFKRAKRAASVLFLRKHSSTASNLGQAASHGSMNTSVGTASTTPEDQPLKKTRSLSNAFAKLVNRRKARRFSDAHAASVPEEEALAHTWHQPRRHTISACRSDDSGSVRSRRMPTARSCETLCSDAASIPRDAGRRGAPPRHPRHSELAHPSELLSPEECLRMRAYAARAQRCDRHSIVRQAMLRGDGSSAATLSNPSSASTASPKSARSFAARNGLQLDRTRCFLG
eukprot:TRINITY_DN3956_c3_g1_i1.p1 TRINITY_DN3956_c3_g1~~TRINITY_DN3956_c3_g1_i1.p1  ORF type:complete len:249 (+),score=66.61 TRINITY_DN3956_c3_g1_i1:64-810(+)